ncbi:uncharacterized protein LOC106083576 [Stomoxys calcitrans]|uniref:uncharacterized protein LOC106083576 n=1 Tax=Stomoxys calcitrans TaxID=35570 RepID=UPI0027E3AEB8|nr:uncharacterized protein LOC106083576 [Stomoxys calcitrans]
MASENVEDWDQPLPMPMDSPDSGDEGLSYEDRVYKANMGKLQKYVEKMCYAPVKPPKANLIIENLSKPKKIQIVCTAENYSQTAEPPERGQRYKRLASKYKTMTTDELQQIIRANNLKASQKENMQKRKHEIYYDMLNKLEQRSRSQYLKFLANKFINFVAKLATTMNIPSTLVDPYARMQRGLFCDILLAIGVQPSSQAAVYYNSKEASEYEVCHRLSHAILSLVIKALDSAATRNVDNLQPIQADFDMDSYIKDRLMSAADRKV